MRDEGFDEVMDALRSSFQLRRGNIVGLHAKGTPPGATAVVTPRTVVVGLSRGRPRPLGSSR